MEGQLERCILAPGHDAKREWKKGYCVFRKHAKNGSKMIEFYKDSNWRRTEPKGVCNLFSEYTVEATPGHSKRKFVLLLKTAEQTYEFSANSQVLCQKWIDTLSTEASQISAAQTMTVIKSFNVVLLNEEHVRKILNTFSGVCQLVVTDAEVILMVDGQHKVLWKFAMIRRYKSQRDTFVIEVGRKAPTGEGEFRFETVNPVELFDVIDKAVKDRMKAKGIEITTAPLPTVNKHSNNTALKSPKDENIRYFQTAHLPLPPTPIASTNQPPNLRPTVESEYSHLNNTQVKTPAVESPSDYDHLFNRADRMMQQRRSEPAIHSNPLPHHLTNNRPLTSNSLGLNDSDDYEQMNSSTNQQKLNNTKPPHGNSTTAQLTKHEKPPVKTPPERKPRPLPAPRIKASAKAPSPRSELRKSYSSPLLDSKADSTPASPTSTNIEQNGQSADYDMLFKSTNNNEIPITTNTNTSEYSHLDHNTDAGKPNKTIPNDISDDLYDVPKSPKQQRSPKQQKSPPTRKGVLKPCRPAPLPPSKPNFAASKQGGIANGRAGLSRSAGANDNIISQLQKRNKDIAAATVAEESGNKLTRASSEDLYDSPATSQQPVGYNQVGELIPGEYHGLSGTKHSMDSDGYVKVPETENTEDIYQVPKGE